MGADFIDYIIADQIVLPFDQQPFYAEKRSSICRTAIRSTTRRSRCRRSAPSRRKPGLPDDGFVFCCFNNSYKITRHRVRRLDAVAAQASKGACCGCRRRTIPRERNLRREARRAASIRRAWCLPARASLAEHLARQRLADLFLDTLPYNAHTTASDALWARAAGADLRGRHLCRAGGREPAARGRPAGAGDRQSRTNTRRSRCGWRTIATACCRSAASWPRTG